MTNILVFGGTFDPFHNGHFKMLDIALAKIQINKVVLVPNYLPVNKQIPKFSAKTRFDMLNNNKNKLPNSDDLELTYDVSDYELNQEKISFTIDTINYLQNKYSNSSITLLIGSDNFFSFHLWKNYTELLKIVTLCVINRGGIEIEDYDTYIEKTLDIVPYKSIVICKNEPIEISSTKIKENILNMEFLKTNLPQFIYNELTIND
jgi:nicotinate-nucleotide adenylyltransferase